ncbi:MAG: imidazolonepropionase [Elusimicrobia bacterium]|nr:imidazolonepropionase [Elusimicrobiota bacterium]
MKQLLTNATLLTFAGPDGPRAGAAAGALGLIRRGAVLMDEGRIVAVGPADQVLKHPDARKGRIHDAGGRVAMPGFVDAHTHPVFAEPRLKDFELRARGRSYQEIAAAGGGIVSSLSGVRGTGERDLTALLQERAARFLACGTTTIEAKSGYGLDKDSELKSLRALKHLAAGGSIGVVPTFLGAHAVPPEYEGRPGEYLRFMAREVLPVVASEGLARYADAFVERGYFGPAEAGEFLRAAKAAGLGVRVHAEQITRSGGARLAAELGACCADHLDRADDEDLGAMKAAGTMACLVPGSNHFLGLAEMPPARRIIDAGVPVALATDFNPGTCPCWNMQEVLAIAVTRMKMTPEEALVASTVNGAWAAGLGRTHGALAAGMAADLSVFECSDYRELCYWFGKNLAATVFKSGKVAHAATDLRL